jgi:hypothetical protein
MKKLVVLSFSVLFALILNQSQAQESGKEQANSTKKEVKSERKALRKLEGNSISEIAKSSFYKDFGNLPGVQWKREMNFDVASFSEKGQKKEAFYDYDANLVGTTMVKTFADLPANAQKEIKTRYKDYSVGKIIFFDDNEWNETDMIMYGSQFNDADNYFVELSKGNEKIVVRVDIPGFVYNFTKL